MLSILSERAKYRPLASSTDDEVVRATRSNWCTRLLFVALWLISCVSFAGIGYQAASNQRMYKHSGLLEPAGETTEIWQYNYTFSREPDQITEDAWRSIFPRGRGFVHHPTIGANVSGLAVFHELHCLSGIRLAYYAAMNKSSEHLLDAASPDSNVDTINSHNDLHHVRHCFDYLRQALMCAADTNLESIDWKLGGSTGWGIKRQCRNYNEVVTWAEKWRLHSQTSIE